MLAQGRWPVEHAGAFALRLLQQMGAIEKLAVERWVLAHKHRIEIPQRLDRLALDREPVAGGTRQTDVPHRRTDQAAAAPAHVARLGGGDHVTPPVQLTHHGEGGVFGGLEGLQRVSNEEDVHGVLSRGSVSLHKTVRAHRSRRPSFPCRCRGPGAPAFTSSSPSTQVGKFAWWSLLVQQGRLQHGHRRFRACSDINLRLADKFLNS